MNAATKEATDKLHRASCIVGFVSQAGLEDPEKINGVLMGQTLAAAEQLILDAMDLLDAAGKLAPAKPGRAS